MIPAPPPPVDPLAANGAGAPESKRKHSGRWWWAVAGGVVVLAAASVVFTEQSAGLPAEIKEPTRANVGQLAVGHCLRAVPKESEVSTVVLLPCTSAHVAQVLAVVNLDDATVPAPEVSTASPSAATPAASAATDDAFTAAASAAVRAACPSPAQLVNPPEDLELLAWVPSTSAWERGTRTALCLGVAPVLTGSLLAP